jgi:DNA-nicking Smr family endonuclease
MTDDSLSDEDKALFREHMRSVKPLNESTAKEKTKTTAPHITPKPREKSLFAPRTKEYFLSDYISESVLTNTILSYMDSSFSPKRFKDLKNGRIAWESRLDLHGLKVEAARKALCHFITTQVELQKRCVLIIHGKGGQDGAPPLIKNLVNRWLPQMEEVIAFYSALPKDGGQGAVYVLLRR